LTLVCEEHHESAASFARSHLANARAAYSAEAAVEIFASGPPDVAIIDVILPGVNGFTLAIRLKQQ
jgi:CheY-like chemotaxis protein